MHPMRHHSTAVQQPGLRQQERTNTHRADAPAVTSVIPNPACELAIAPNVLHIARPRNDQRVDPASIKYADGLRYDTHTVGTHDRAATNRDDRAVVDACRADIVRMRRCDVEGFEWS